MDLPNNNIQRESCAICFENDKQMVQLSCNLYFHRNCVKAWLNKHHTCPLCRKRTTIKLSRKDYMVIIARNMLMWKRTSNTVKKYCFRPTQKKNSQYYHEVYNKLNYQHNTNIYKSYNRNK